MDPKDRIDLWKKYEDVAMHFNELLIRLRAQALGAITSIVAAAGFFVGFFVRKDTSPPWPEAFVVSLLLLLSWVTLWIIDLTYYSRLLRGAVNALLKLEKESADEIFLSSKIEEVFGGNRDENERGLRWQNKVFYVPLAIFLFALTVFCLYETLRDNALLRLRYPSSQSGSGFSEPFPGTTEGGLPDLDRSTRAFALRRLLDFQGYHDVHFKMNGEQIELWGSVPTEDDRAIVRELASAAGGATGITDRLRVSGGSATP